MIRLDRIWKKHVEFYGEEGKQYVRFHRQSYINAVEDVCGKDSMIMWNNGGVEYTELTPIPFCEVVGIDY